MSNTKKLLDDGTIEVTTTKIIPRYELKINNRPDDIYYVDDMDYIHSECVITSSGDFSTLDNSNGFKFDGYDNLAEAYVAWQEYIKENYPLLVPMMLCAHIHGRTSFYINNDGSKSCQFDSGVVGFIAIPKHVEYTDVANTLTDAWEGDYTIYEVYDNLEDDFVEEFVYAGRTPHSELEKFLNEAKTKYNIEGD